MASTYFKITDTAAAREIFERIIILAPESLYAEWSERYVQAIIQRETEYKQPGGPKLYDVFIQVAPQLDFNVPEDPNVGSTFSDDESFRFTNTPRSASGQSSSATGCSAHISRPTRASTRKGA